MGGVGGVLATGGPVGDEKSEGQLLQVTLHSSATNDPLIVSEQNFA